MGPDGAFETNGKPPYGVRDGGIVYFKMTKRTAKAWIKYHIVKRPQVGR